MPENLLKSETLEEARERLLALSEAEKAGMESATEGQLVVTRGEPVDEEDVRAIDARHQLSLGMADLDERRAQQAEKPQAVDARQGGAQAPAQQTPASGKPKNEQRPK